MVIRVGQWRYYLACPGINDPQRPPGRDQSRSHTHTASFHTPAGHVTPAEAEITATSAESGPDWFCWSCFNVVIGVNVIPVGAVNPGHLPLS